MTTQLLSDCCNATVLTLVACVGAAPSYSCHKCHKHPCSVHPEPERKEGDETCATQTTPLSITDSSKSTTLPVASEGAPKFYPEAAPKCPTCGKGRNYPNCSDGFHIFADAPTETDEEPDACAFCGSADSIELWPFRSVLTPMCPACVKREAGCDPSRPAEAPPESETPETDAVLRRIAGGLPAYASELRDLAFRLERERDEAIQKNNDWAEAAGHVESHYQEVKAELAEAQRALQEVREINDQYKQLAYLAVPLADGMQGGRDRIRLLVADRDTARAELAQLQRQRAADVALLRVRLIDLCRKHGIPETDEENGESVTAMIERLAQERNEARERIEQLSFDLAATFAILWESDGSAYENNVPAWATKRMQEIETLRAESKAAMEELEKTKKERDDLLKQKAEVIKILQNYDNLWHQRDVATAELSRLRQRVAELLHVLNELVERKDDAHGFYYTLKRMGGCGSELSSAIDAAMKQP